MSSMGQASVPQVRALGAIAAAELAVGGFSPASLPGRIAGLSGADAASVEGGIYAGRLLLDSLGMGALEVDAELSMTIASLLDSQGSEGSEAWARSLEVRGGTSPGTRLAAFIASIRAAVRDGKRRDARGSEDARGGHRAGPVSSSPLVVAPRRDEALPSQASRLDAASARQGPAAGADPSDLTFDDDVRGIDTDDLLSGAVDVDLGLEGAINLDDEPLGGDGAGL